MPDNSREYTAAQASPRTPWLETLRVYLEPASLRMLALGFSAGLPLLLVLGTLSFRLREAGINRSTIGYLSWVGLAYGFKWLWAPLVDHMPIPLLTRLLGRRRSWLLLAQGLVTAGLVGMALTDPHQALGPIVGCALAVAFGSATQDIALDAFRIESAHTDRQAALAAAYMSGYRLAMIWAGAGVLWIAARAQDAATIGQAVAQDAAAHQNGAWRVAYLAMAASMAVGWVTVLFSHEPAPMQRPPAKNAVQWIQDVLLGPFTDFFQRYGWYAMLILALIAMYRISDVVLGVMAYPFYVDQGFSKDEVAAVSKIYGVFMTLAGAFAGGVLTLRLGVMRTLMLGALLSASTNLLYVWLAGRGHDLSALITVVSIDNLAGGIASSAFIAYLSSLTNVRYSATQYALFSSVMLLLPKFVAGFSGRYVDTFGYAQFFSVAALLGLPVLVLIWLVSRFEKTDGA
ncbi:MFS transporter [Verminephrobacter aporrectodeae subsp. tuberculatae]|uniref:AmpG family muropeptide MFS transporter n=1 Tax=Verminephrobacter aporrectodeae TaxID=1110389 RepID=UPI00224369BA|nr:MFS transporter [Verminephrobacter aporrectodeae]MCW8208848.1 MFS transporter [Verminephrobacter aporrectodeae subsp. tuberculatae]